MRIILAFACLWLCASARASEDVELKAAPGRETAARNCSACHSLDYISMNSRFLTRAEWQTEVEKMTGAYGAPIDADEAKAIVDYLAENY